MYSVVSKEQGPSSGKGGHAGHYREVAQVEVGVIVGDTGWLILAGRVDGERIQIGIDNADIGPLEHMYT